MAHALIVDNEVNARDALAEPINLARVRTILERMPRAARRSVSPPERFPSAIAAAARTGGRELIYITLEQCDGVKTRAAKILGISLRTQYNRLAHYESARAGRAPPAAAPGPGPLATQGAAHAPRSGVRTIECDGPPCKPAKGRAS